MKTRDTQRKQPRRDMLKSHLIAEHRHDPYKPRKKLSEPAVCKQCMAVLKGGRWQWTTEPLEGAHWELCPACRRINDKYPAGEMTLSGGFLKAHKQEILRLVHNVEALERYEHPMGRVMGVTDEKGRVVITTTDIHLPRRIGHAISRAYKGELETHYDEAGHFVRVAWRRDD